MFPDHSVTVARRDFTFRYLSPEHWLDVFRRYYGPTHRAFASIDTNAQVALEAEIHELLRSQNRSGDETLVLPSAYLEVVIERP